jgi:hypothetical protein
MIVVISSCIVTPCVTDWKGISWHITEELRVCACVCNVLERWPLWRCAAAAAGCLGAIVGLC